LRTQRVELSFEMTEMRYELVFDGRLRPGVSLQRARDAIQARFKLSGPQLERLFKGAPVTVKRNLDAASADRYQRAFLDAGAIVDRHALDAGAEPMSAGATRSPSASEEPHRRLCANVPENETLELLPPGAPVAEEPTVTAPTAPDTSRLSLALPEKSGLEDCAPRPSPPPTLDLSPYQLVPLERERADADDSSDNTEAR
jgi:hypothetical protein